MALTTPALVVIDLQKGIVAMPTAHPVEAVHRRRPGRADASRGWGSGRGFDRGVSAELRRPRRSWRA
jgi:hypothetical protein